MTDSVVGVKQSTAPDRYMDNEAVESDAAPEGELAHRQRVAAFAPGGGLLATEDTVAGLLTDAELRAAPVEITGTVAATGASLAVSEALNVTNHNLLTAGYSATTAISNDYELDSLELHFSTRAARTITLTTEDGTVLYKRVGNYALDVEVSFGGKKFNGGEDLTLTVTQTASACTMSGKLVTAQGSLPLVGNPVVEQGTSPWVVEERAVANVRNLSQFYNVRGQRFIATTDYVPLTDNAANQPLALFQNPADSGKVILFDHAEFGATKNTTFTRFGGGTTPLIGTPPAKSIGRTDGGASSSVTKLYVGGNGSANARGVTVAAQFSVSAAGTVRKVAPMLAYGGYQIDPQTTMVLQPGQQSYWIVDEPAGGGSGTFNAFIDFEWIEMSTADWAALVAAMLAKAPY